MSSSLATLQSLAVQVPAFPKPPIHSSNSLLGSSAAGASPQRSEHLCSEHCDTPLGSSRWTHVWKPEKPWHDRASLPSGLSRWEPISDRERYSVIQTPKPLGQARMAFDIAVPSTRSVTLVSKRESIGTSPKAKD